MMRAGLSLLVAIAVCQPAAAQETGLLLGLAGPEERDSVPAELTTEWITFGRGAARRVQTLRGLVVPRSTGFWRVGTTRACELPDSTDPDDLNRVHCYDSLWTAPASEPLRRVTENWTEPCTTEFLDLNFVSPSHLSLSSRLWESDCAARSFSDTYRSWVRTHESADPMPFSRLGPGASEAYQAAARTAFVFGSAHDEPEPQNETCRAEPLEQGGWEIKRIDGEWRALLFQQQGSELCQVHDTVEWKLPATVVGYAEPALDWAAVARLEPDARQAFAAPGGALMVIVTPAALRLYSSNPPAAARRVLELPARKVVMVQWATGRSVARWTGMLGVLK